MRAIYQFVMALMLYAQGTAAQDIAAVARVDPGRSQISDQWFGKTSLSIGLGFGVPFRVFTLDDPMRLVVDFGEADWTGVEPEMILTEPGRISALRFGTFQPGWSRLVADLSEPMLPREIGMPIDHSNGQVNLSIILEAVDKEEFTSKAGVPGGSTWETLNELSLYKDPPPVEADVFLVMIDPGHGGIDPGAQREGVDEKDLMLDIARALQDSLRRAGVAAEMTRTDDVFVALETRVAMAHRAKADMFISLHADSLRDGGAKGATVYTLSDEASDAATAHLAARHNRADIIAGVDLTGADDQVAGVLLDLARQETEPRSAALAEVLVNAMTQAGGPMNRKPQRKAGFSVLKSADIPSVLVEVGFLSSDRDLTNLRDPVWRAVMVEGMAQAILEWRDLDAARKPLIRQ